MTEVTPLALTAVFCMILGFSAKAGLFPLHNWLPSAHPVAPAPAHALLSGVIAKVGAVAVIRTIYCMVGVELLRGWLRENGYRCTEERLVQDKGKLYVILSVTGGPSGEASDAERYGGFCLEHDPLYGLYLEQQLRRLYLRMDGLHRGGDESEAEPLAALADILEEKKEAWQRGNGQ